MTEKERRALNNKIRREFGPQQYRPCVVPKAYNDPAASCIRTIDARKQINQHRR